MSEKDFKIEVTKEMMAKVASLKEFIEFWDKDFKPYAIACIKGGLPLYIEMSRLSEDYGDVADYDMPSYYIVREDKTNYDDVQKRLDNLSMKKSKKDRMMYKIISRKNEYDKKCNKIYDEAEKLGIRDFSAIHFINIFLFDVDTAIKEYRNPGMSMLSMYKIFHDETYYEIAYENDHDCDEEKNYREFAKKIEHSIDLLKNVN